jgi:hypothetical protein
LVFFGDAHALRLCIEQLIQRFFDRTANHFIEMIANGRLINFNDFFKLSCPMAVLLAMC